MLRHSCTPKGRAGKPVKPAGKKYDDRTRLKLEKSLSEPLGVLPTDPDPIITLVVGSDRRILAAHEDILSCSPFFCTAIGDQFLTDGTKRVDLPDEEPEIVSCILEFLYKGDYFPRLLHDSDRGNWYLENAESFNGSYSSKPTIYHSGIDAVILRDSAVYCAAEKYGLEELKDLALRKQGLQSRIPVDVILRSARYAYDNTPDLESRLRAHYLAMIIRCRDIFKASGTMQMEIEAGHPLYFDLFVAMCNHIDDLDGRSRLNFCS